MVVLLRQSRHGELIHAFVDVEEGRPLVLIQIVSVLGFLPLHDVEDVGVRIKEVGVRVDRRPSSVKRDLVGLLNRGHPVVAFPELAILPIFAVHLLHFFEGLLLFAGIESFLLV